MSKLNAGGERVGVIKLHTENEKLIFDDKPIITSGNININSINVTLCDRWLSLGETAEFWAVFYKNESEMLKRKLENGSCLIPNEVLTSKGVFYFGIYAEAANGERVKTSKVVEYSVKQGTATEAETVSKIVVAAQAETRENLASLLETLTGEEQTGKTLSELNAGINAEIGELVKLIDESGVIEYDNSF
jgi:hypothetical protein